MSGAGKEQMSRSAPLTLWHEWQVVGEAGQDVEDDQESLLKTRVGEKAEWAKQGQCQPSAGTDSSRGHP